MDTFVMLFGHLRSWCLTHPAQLGTDYFVVLFVVMLAGLLGGRKRV